jgi:hypothetical protein
MRNKTIFICLVVIVGLASVQALAQCASNLTYQNLLSAGNYWTGYTNDPATGAIGGVSLVVGKGDPAIGSGEDSGIYPMTFNGCSGPAGCQSRLIGVNFRVAAQTAQGANAWDVCPAVSENLTVIMWEADAEGSSGHAAKFCAATAKVVTGAWAFSAAMSPQNNKVFMSFPTPEIRSSVNDGGGNYHFVVRMYIPGCSSDGSGNPTCSGNVFANNTAFKRQYYDSTITPPIVITGWKVYRYVGAAAPVNGDISTGGWVLDGTAAIADNANSYTDYTSTSFALGSNKAWFAVAPAFADGFAPFAAYSSPYSGFFVGANSGIIGPTAAPLFSASGAGLNKGTVTATWRSNVETGVASYQVFYAGKKNGNYKPIDSTVTAPKGNNSSYSVTFAKPSPNAKFFVKVKATMMDGQDQWADAVKVGANASAPELDD